MIVDLAAATGLISSAPMPGYGKRFEDVTAADVAEWRRIFGEDFVQLQLSQQGRRRLLEQAAAGGATQRRKLEQHDEWGAVSLSLRLARYADVYTQGHKCVRAHSSQAGWSPLNC